MKHLFSRPLLEGAHSPSRWCSLIFKGKHRKTSLCRIWLQSFKTKSISCLPFPSVFWNNIWSSVWSLWRTANDFKACSEVIYQDTITCSTFEKWFSLRSNIWYEFNNLPYYFSFFFFLKEITVVKRKLSSMIEINW